MLCLKALQKQKKRCIDTTYIAHKLDKKRGAVSKSINVLLGFGYLSRNRNSNNNAYWYEVKGEPMSNEKRADNAQCHQNDTSNCHQNRTPIYSNNNSNKYNRDSGITTNEPICEIPQKNNNLSFLEEVTEEASRFVSRFENTKPEIR